MSLPQEGAEGGRDISQRERCVMFHSSSATVCHPIVPLFVFGMMAAECSWVTNADIADTIAPWTGIPID